MIRAALALILVIGCGDAANGAPKGEKKSPEDARKVRTIDVRRTCWKLWTERIGTDCVPTLR